MEIQKFIETIWSYYQDNSRSLPWRMPNNDGTFNPYVILVSEIMLQQTQVERVIPKFYKFLDSFPDIQSLANASFQEVLQHWSGLGYNRRAKYLHDSAKKLATRSFPDTPEKLVSIKGIGENTAAAICVYSFNKPLVFIETNVRTVYTHHFFNQQDAIDDKDIKKKIAESLDVLGEISPREFYWALMDYGTYLKKNGIKNNAQSKHYMKQSKFEGSSRQIRGRIISFLAQAQEIEGVLLEHEINDSRTGKIVEDLVQEGMLIKNGSKISLP